ncbi:MAG: sensor histidine kinase [Deltaproteobacteria bacterium]
MGIRGKLFLVHVLVLTIGFGGADAWLLGHLDGGLTERLWLDLALALVVATFLSLTVSKALVRSLRTLAAAADAMTAGNLSIDARVGGSDELARLGHALERLGERLASELATIGEERDRLNAILGSMGEGVLVLGRDQRILLANPSARALLDLSGSHRPDPTLLEAGRLPALHALATRALGGERPADELALPDGRQLLVRGTPLAGTGAVLVLHDLTDIRRLEAVRRDFVANVSHELRTPLAAIRGYAETLIDGGTEDPVRAREFSEVIQRHAERLGRLLDDLLELSRLESGHRPLAREPVSCVDAGASVLEIIGPKATRRGVQLENALPDDSPVLGDRDAIEQVLLNLLDNAVKFTPAGARVILSATPANDPSRLRILVSDEGIGIDASHLPRLFERFYRVDAGRSRETGGTGLGLAIVKHLVQALGGEVGAESASGRGSTFWFELPRAP